MKIQSMLFYLAQLIVYSLITWKAESTLSAVLAYIVLVILLSGIAKNLINRLDG